MTDVTPDFVAELLRRRKREEVVAKGDADQIFGYALAVRDGHPLAMVHGDGSRFGISAAAYWAAFLAPDVYVASDSYLMYKSTPEMPERSLKEMWDAGDREGIVECLLVAHCRDGEPATMTSMPYEHEGHDLRWLPPETLHAMEGNVPDAARDGFAAQVKFRDEYREVIGFLGAGISPEEKMVHEVRAIARFASTAQREVLAVSVLIGELVTFRGGVEVPAWP